MALSPRELQIRDFGREHGQTTEQITQAIQISRGIVPAQTTQPKEGFFSGELKGGADTSQLTGAKRFGAELFQSTLGSKGLLGVAQLPAKAIGTASALKEQTSLDEERGQSFEQMRQLFIKMRETKDPEEKERLRKLFKGLGISVKQLEEAQRGLDRFTVTPKEALGTAVSAAATVAPVGKFRGVSGVQKALTSGREALRGAGFAAGTALSEDRLPTAEELGTGAAIGAAVPVVGGFVGGLVSKVGGVSKNVVKRFAGGLGVSVDDILKNPKVAEKTVQTLLKGEKTPGNILRENAEALVKDIQRFKRQISNTFGKGLEALKATDISPAQFRAGIQPVLDKIGSIIVKGKRVLNNVEFDDPKNLKKASELISRLQKVETDGKSLRKLIDDIDASKFKTATSDERISYNRFLDELASGVRSAINRATNKLNEINKVFTADKQIVEVIEQEFGKVKFSNLSEVNKVAKKIETLLKKKGIADEVIDEFFARVGREPGALRATEAVRGAFSKEIEAEGAGLGFFAMLRTLTAGFLDPKDITRLTVFIARRSEATEAQVRPVIETLAKLRPAARVGVIKLLDEMINVSEETR